MNCISLWRFVASSLELSQIAKTPVQLRFSIAREEEEAPHHSTQSHICLFLLQPLSYFHNQNENVYETKHSAFLKDYLTCKMVTMMGLGRDLSTINIAA